MPILTLKVCIIALVAQTVASSVCDKAILFGISSVSANITSDVDYGLQLLQKNAHSRSGETDGAPASDVNALQLLQRKAKCHMNSQVNSQVSSELESKLEGKHWTLKRVERAAPHNTSLMSLIARLEPYRKSGAFQVSIQWLWPMCYVIVLMLFSLGAGRIGYPTLGEEEEKVVAASIQTTTTKPSIGPAVGWNAPGAVSKKLPVVQNPVQSIKSQAASAPAAPMTASVTSASLPPLMVASAPVPAKVASASMPAKVQVLAPQGKSRNVSLNAMEVPAPQAFVETIAMQPKEAVQVVEVIPTTSEPPIMVAAPPVAPLAVALQAPPPMAVQAPPLAVPPVVAQTSPTVKVPVMVDMRQLQPEPTVSVPVIFAAPTPSATAPAPAGLGREVVTVSRSSSAATAASAHLVTPVATPPVSQSQSFEREIQVAKKGPARFDVLPDAIPLEEDVVLIEPEEVYIYMKNGDETFALVDVRDSDRNVGHIEDTVHVPCNEADGFDSKVDELLEEFEDMDMVVFHCQFSCHRGPYCANLYRARAPEGQVVAVMNGGFKGWLELGFPIVPGEGELADKVYANSVALQQGRLAAEKAARSRAGGVKTA